MGRKMPRVHSAIFKTKRQGKIPCSCTELPTQEAYCWRFCFLAQQSVEYWAWRFNFNKVLCEGK